MKTGAETMAGPEIVVVPGFAAMSGMAADVVVETLNRTPDAAISLPTGSTPVGMFNEIVRRREAGEVDLTQFQMFCLDEYIGKSIADQNSLTAWLMKTFILPAGIPLQHVHTLPTLASDPERAAVEYEREITQAGGLDLAVLGIGGNGHIAYNEPGSLGDSRTRVVNLTPESIDQAAGYFDGATVPSKAMTVGVGTLLEAKRIYLIASGAGKADIIQQALQGPISAEVPASWLRLTPEKVTFILDESAASRL